MIASVYERRNIAPGGFEWENQTNRHCSIRWLIARSALQKRRTCTSAWPSTAGKWRARSVSCAAESNRRQRTNRDCDRRRHPRQFEQRGSQSNCASSRATNPTTSRCCKRSDAQARRRHDRRPPARFIESLSPDFFSSQVIIQEEQSGSGTFDLRMVHGLSDARHQTNVTVWTCRAKDYPIAYFVGFGFGCAGASTARSLSRAKRPR